MVGANPTTTKDRNQLIEMFLDATPGEVYANGRLATHGTENGVQLVAYDKHVLARVNRAADEITLFTGHYGTQSKAVSTYIHYLGKLLSEREGFSVTVRENESPSFRQGVVAESAQFIGQYFHFDGGMSAVERDALKTVNESLASALSE